MKCPYKPSGTRKGILKTWQLFCQTTLSAARTNPTHMPPSMHDAECTMKAVDSDKKQPHAAVQCMRQSSMCTKHVVPCCAVLCHARHVHQDCWVPLALTLLYKVRQSAQPVWLSNLHPLSQCRTQDGTVLRTRFQTYKQLGPHTHANPEPRRCKRWFEQRAANIFFLQLQWNSLFHANQTCHRHESDAGEHCSCRIPCSSPVVQP
jgi:hypothetical protein